MAVGLDSGLLQRGIDRRKLSVELGAEPVPDRDDCQRNAGRDQPVLNGGSARLVAHESAKGFIAPTMRANAKGRMNPTK
jgi:hypothetical protein